MRVLVLGGTGNLGSRLHHALARRGHTVVAFVRNPAKLQSDAGTYQHRLLIEQGDGKRAAEIKDAATRHKCNAIINAAGHAAMAPWGKSDLPAIVSAVIQAALEIGQERNRPMRVWFLGGQGILEIPTENKMIVNYIPMFREHITTWNKLRDLPPSAISWSILCPGLMRPVGESPLSTPATGSVDNLSATATVPPEWSTKFLRVPVIGRYLNIMSQISSYATCYEDNAEFIANDLSQDRDSEWIFQRVGVKERQGSCL
ncbi:hypothetical protein BDV25DRAFT_146476 [Aspergillus avenaceus]|uniref:NAD(P)-binding domain-containing protein n=1 Tax=Aspergillus avenaceus TaxID=36643 RepID=A0A5N6U9M2_ASPAV|nr:hypothetical protein BDV25DRAFT_146476 [Aspergillus avenaceus]